jgi:hypothetical protein
MIFFRETIYRRRDSCRCRKCRLCGRDEIAKQKEVCVSVRRPLLLFFSVCVRSVILTPVYGENAHHVVLPAGSLVNDSPTGNPYMIIM